MGCSILIKIIIKIEFIIKIIMLKNTKTIKKIIYHNITHNKFNLYGNGLKIPSHNINL
jgi:hypothetical protein